MRHGRFCGLLVAAAACAGPAPERAPASVEFADSAGVRLVHNLDASIDTFTTLSERLRIGAAEGAPEYLFHAIAGLAVADDGRFFVGDAGSGSIRVFDARGTHVRNVGRRGSGPGEFRAISRLVLHGDTLLVYDAAALRVTLLDTAGALLATYPALLGDGTQLVPHAGARGGWFVGYAQSRMAQRAALRSGANVAPRPGDVVQDSTAVRWMAAADYHAVAGGREEDAAARVRTLAWLPDRRAFVMIGVEGLTSATPLFEPAPQRAYARDGHVLIAPGWPYRIDILNTEGSLLRRVTRAHDSVAVTAAHAAEYYRRAERGLQRGATTSALQLHRTRRDLPRSGYLPVIGGLLAAPDGGFWARREDVHADPVRLEWTAGEPPLPGYWDVFDGEGRFLRTVRLPPGFTPRQVLPDGVAGIARDDDGVQFVVVLGG